MGTRPLNKGTNRPITLCTVKLFIQLMYNKNDHLAKWSNFCQIFVSSFAHTKASKNKLKDASFIFSMANVTILSIFRTHAQKEYRKVSKRKDIYTLNILALLLFENLQRIYLNSRLNGTLS